MLGQGGSVCYFRRGAQSSRLCDPSSSCRSRPPFPGPPVLSVRHCAASTTKHLPSASPPATHTPDPALARQYCRADVGGRSRRGGDGGLAERAAANRRNGHTANAPQPRHRCHQNPPLPRPKRIAQRAIPPPSAAAVTVESRAATCTLARPRNHAPAPAPQPRVARPAALFQQRWPCFCHRGPTAARLRRRWAHAWRVTARLVAASGCVQSVAVALPGAKRAGAAGDERALTCHVTMSRSQTRKAEAQEMVIKW